MNIEMKKLKDFDLQEPKISMLQLVQVNFAEKPSDQEDGEK